MGLLVWQTEMQSQMPEWQQAQSLVQYLMRTLADFMKTGEKEDGVPRLELTEQTIFRLTWVQCCLFVLWPPKGKRNTVHGLPATNYTYPQTVVLGTLTRRPARQRFDRQLLVMIIRPRRVQFSELQKQLTKLHHCKQECDLLLFTTEPNGRTKSLVTNRQTIVKLKKQNSHQRMHS